MFRKYSRNTKTAVLLSLLLVLLGFYYVSGSFQPASQCEGSLTPENSGCIIGADIGTGILLLFGMVVIIIGDLILAISLMLSSSKSKSLKFVKVIQILGIGMAIIVLALLFAYIGLKTGPSSISKSTFT